jgi:hypothetical protein
MKGRAAMIDEELIWQKREVTGEAVLACENCGRPVSATLLRDVPDETTADGGAGMRICAACLEAIERGTEPVELADDDELEPVL